jgi:epoxyqueuosine reductase
LEAALQTEHSRFRRTSAFVDGFMRKVTTPKRLSRLWWVPHPGFLLRRYAPSLGAWPTFDVEVPDALRDVAGIRRDVEAEERASKIAPIRDWGEIHPDTLAFIFSHGWRYFVWGAPRRQRAKRAARKLARKDTTSARRAVPQSPEELTAALKAKAAELGISACGIANRDDKYIFSDHIHQQVGDRMIVCALESRWEACQTAPSVYAQRALTAAGTELYKLITHLAEFLLEQGYRVRFPEGDAGDGIALHFAVAAGIGQLGVNGQVLTPFAGSRVRFLTLNTDAPLVVDHPVDYGINKICDACQICVRRCPSGAIPANRKMHRGVEKAKLNAKRCVPVVAQMSECAVCMKVCPVQRYGLTRVMNEFVATGDILGKGTDELESYVFLGIPYGPGERPRLDPEFFSAVPFEEANVDVAGPSVPSGRGASGR